MLKHQLIHPQINAILGKAGHHGKILIADGNYPVSSKKGPNAEIVNLNLMPGVVNCAQVLQAILSAVPIDEIFTMMYTSDDPYALDADPPVAEAPTAVATATCTQQVEYAGVLRGTDQPDGARLLIDYLTGPEFQADLPLTQFVYPVRRDVALPDAFVRWAARPADPIRLDAGAVSANRSAWLERWTDLVLR